MILLNPYLWVCIMLLQYFLRISWCLFVWDNISGESISWYNFHQFSYDSRMFFQQTTLLLFIYSTIHVVIYLSICLSIYLLIYLFIYLFIYFIYLFIYSFIYLFIYFSCRFSLFFDLRYFKSKVGKLLVHFQSRVGSSESY